MSTREHRVRALLFTGRARRCLIAVGTTGDHDYSFRSTPELKPWPAKWAQLQALTGIDGGGIDPSARNTPSFPGGLPGLDKSLLDLSFAPAVPPSEALTKVTISLMSAAPRLAHPIMQILGHRGVRLKENMGIRPERSESHCGMYTRRTARVSLALGVRSAVPSRQWLTVDQTPRQGLAVIMRSCQTDAVDCRGWKSFSDLMLDLP